MSLIDWSLLFSRYDLYSALLYSVQCASRKAEWGRKMCIQSNLEVEFLWELKSIILLFSCEGAKICKKTLKFHWLNVSHHQRVTAELGIINVNNSISRYNSLCLWSNSISLFLNCMHCSGFQLTWQSSNMQLEQNHKVPSLGFTHNLVSYQYMKTSGVPFTEVINDCTPQSSVDFVVSRCSMTKWMIHLWDNNSSYCWANY